MVKQGIHRLALAFKTVRTGWTKTLTRGQPLWDTFEKRVRVSGLSLALLQLPQAGAKALSALSGAWKG